MTANVIHLARRPGTATPTTPTTTGHDVATLQAHQDAENALSMALHYLRSGPSNVPGAKRKAVQALDALNTLHTLAPAGAGARVPVAVEA